MGKMKEYAMWQEEMGYAKWDEDNGIWLTDLGLQKGEGEILKEYLNRDKSVSVVRVKQVKNDGNLSDGQLKQVLWKVNGTCVLSSSSLKIYDGDEVVNETMFFTATENGTITSHEDIHVMYPAEFDDAKVAIELHRWANEEISEWTGDTNENN